MARSHRILRAALAMLMLGLAACGSATPSALTADPATSTAATSSKAALTTSASAAARDTASTAAIAMDYATLPQSKTPEGYYQLGSPDAPASMTHYSDFI